MGHHAEHSHVIFHEYNSVKSGMVLLTVWEISGQKRKRTIKAQIKKEDEAERDIREAETWKKQEVVWGGSFADRSPVFLLRLRWLTVTRWILIKPPWLREDLKNAVVSTQLWDCSGPQQQAGSQQHRTGGYQARLTLQKISICTNPSVTHSAFFFLSNWESTSAEGSLSCKKLSIGGMVVWAGSDNVRSSGTPHLQLI